jgi:non-specific protein-tyrosine kinase
MAMTPLYEARIQLFVSTPSSALDISALVQGSSFSQQRVKSYAQIVNSPTVLEPVIKNLRLETSAEDLSKFVKASAPLDTVLINVTVTNESATRAAFIANAIGVEFARVANSIESSQEAGSNAIKVTMIKRASVPESPASPRLPLNLTLGLILGFGLGIGISILRQVFDNTVKKETDLGSTTLLAAIGFDKSAKASPLISSISRYAARTEAFRLLRTNLQYSRAEGSPKVIAVTSAVPGEGKTTTAINLAISMASTGSKTLIIEADMRRPKVHEYLGVQKSAEGLAELLIGKSGESISSSLSSLVVQNERIPGVDLLPSGHLAPNPSELLDSSKFTQLIEVARGQYANVIIDCPPALPVADASIISTRSDCVVVVVQAGVTKVSQFNGVCDGVRAVGGHVLGAVINMIPISKIDSDYGYKYGYGYEGGYAGSRQDSQNGLSLPYAPTSER